jgi:thiamine biosynthesis lipoprotein
MKPRLLGGLSVLLFAAVGAAARGGEEPALSRFSFTEPHMGTRFQVLVWAPDEDAARKAAKAAFARVAALNGIMSDYEATSELMRLCARAGGPPVPVSAELFFVLSRAQQVSRQSDGAFDVTVGPVVRLWRRARRTRKLPDPEKLAAARDLVGYRNVRLDEKARTVQLLKAGMQLDLGGIAKGYAADEALAVLKKHGLPRALVAAGGDIAVGAPPPGAEGWKVAIAPLPGEKVGDRHMLLRDDAVSTSGDAEQFVEIDGKRYSHIIDPRTGQALVGRMSATVVAKKGIDSDSLTKVACVLGPERGLKLIEDAGASGRVVRRTDAGLETAVSKNFPKLHPPAGDR